MTAAHERRRLTRDDTGSAVVEFIALAVLLLVPVVYLVLTLGRLQAAALAAEGAAREAGRAYVTAQDDAEGRERAQAAAALAFADQGFASGTTRSVELGCDHPDCLVPDGRVRVHSRLFVDLPGVPRFLSRAVPARVEVTATHVAAVDRFRTQAGGRR